LTRSPSYGGPEDRELPRPAMTNLEFEAAAAQFTLEMRVLYDNHINQATKTVLSDPL